MKLLPIVVAGVILALIWPPLALMFLIVVVALYFFQKYYSRRLDKAEQTQMRD
jgi:membrane protein implicated in regulation of membrane protease activity